MSNYYEYRKVKVAIAHRLFKLDGWKVYGYKPDESDGMTDYWSPASWGGIAEKNGYKLVVDHPYAQEERRYTVRTSAQAAIDAKTAAKIAKLEEMRLDRGASEGEAETARKAIEALKSKAQEAAQGETATREIIEPGHMANPPRCNWHIEKDGIIIDKGTGLLRFSNVPDITDERETQDWQDYNNLSADAWKAKKKAELASYYYEKDIDAVVEHRYSDAKENYALLEKFNILINRFNTICGGMMGNTDDFYTYQEVTKTEYKTEIKAQETETGSIKEGQHFIIKKYYWGGVCEGYVYIIHEHTGTDGKPWFSARRLNGKNTKELTGTANAANSFGFVDENRLNNWLKKGIIAFCDLVEVKTPYEVKKVVKAKKETESAVENTTQEPETEEAEQNPAEEENATEAQESAGNIPPYKCAEDMKAAFIADGWSADVELREATPKEINKSGFYIKQAAESGRKFFVMTGSGNMYDDHGKVVYYNVPCCDATTIPDNVAPEDAPTPEESAETVTETAPEEATQEEAQEPEAVKEEAASDMFATLAAAYFAGKTVKSKPRKVEQEHEQPAEPETVEPEPEPEPEPIAPGYHENQNDRFTEEERKALSEGLNVWKTGAYSQNDCYFSALYADNVRLIYSVYAWKDSAQRIQPGRQPEYRGFLIDTDFYSNPTEIRAKLNADIDDYIMQHIQSEDAAAANMEKNAQKVREYEREQINDLLTADYTREAKDYFYRREKPLLSMYSGENHEQETLIEYILQPERMIEKAASEYMARSAVSIYRYYIRYNRISAALAAIENDKENVAHTLRKIAESISDEKNVKIELESGSVVKVEARGVKNITSWGTISNYDVAAADRQYLKKNQYGNYKDIQYTEIKAIRHGGRVLYSA